MWSKDCFICLPSFGVSIKVNPAKINYLQTRMVDKKQLESYNTFKGW